MGVEFIAQLGQRPARVRLGAVHGQPAARFVIVAIGGADHREPVKAAIDAITGKAARDTAAVAAIGQADAAAMGAAIGQQILGAHGFIAHGTGSGAEARIGGGGADLDLDRFQEGRIDDGRAGMVPAGHALRHAVNGDGKVRLLHAKDVDAFRGAGAARDRHRRIALEQFRDIGGLHRLDILLRHDRAAGGFDVFLTVGDQRDLVEHHGFCRGLLRLIAVLRVKRCRKRKRRYAGKRDDAAQSHCQSLDLVLVCCQLPSLQGIGNENSQDL